MNKQEYNAVLASNWIDVDIAARLKDGKNFQSNFQMCRSTINQGNVGLKYSKGLMWLSIE
jgi:hypothetical protein